VTDPSVAFDSQGNVYVLTLQTTGDGDGELYLTEFNFSGPSPQFIAAYNVYQWVAGSDGVTDPVMAVDTSLSDQHTNNIYIAWASVDTIPASFPATSFNPNRAELVVGTPIASPSVPNEQSLAFSGVTTVNVGGNFGGFANHGQDNSHPQLVIDQNASGQVTVAWDDFGSGSGAATPFDVLNSSLVQAGDTFGFSGTTGPIAPGTSGNSSPGNWAAPVIYSAGLATSSSPADPVGIATEVNGGTTDVNGDKLDDVVVADQGTGQIGVAFDSATGALGATAVYSAVGSPSGVSLGDFVSGHSNANILDAATSNGASAGGVSVNPNGPNGTPPTDGTGVFKSAVPLQSVTGGSAETAIVTADLDGNGIPDIVAADPGKGAIDIWLNPAAGSSAPISVPLPGGDVPIAVVVDKFRGSSQDIAVLNTNGTIVILQNGITAGNPVVPGDFTPVTAATIAGAVSMTSGSVTGNAALPDLIVTRNSPGQNDLFVVQNLSSSSTLSFGTPAAVPGSNIGGTPVSGEQGVAAGTLSTSGNYSSYKDIAVVYAATGNATIPANESVVAVFQNLDNGQFSRTLVAGADFDAGQENPRAIALLHLTNSDTLTFEDIVVTNNDNFDRSTFAGTISVLQPAATTAITRGKTTPFTDSVNVPNQAAVTNLTVKVDLTDQQSVANLSLVLETPSGDQITLVRNQNNAAGTANTGVGLPSAGFTHHNRIFWKSGRTLRLRLVQYSRVGVKDGQFDFLG